MFDTNLYLYNNGLMPTTNGRIREETMSLLNINYFGGTAGSVRDQVVKSQGYKLWDAADPNFLKKYVLSMIKDSNTNNNQLQIPKQDRGKK